LVIVSLFKRVYAAERDIFKKLRDDLQKGSRDDDG
jgi:hypothetical protein